MEIKTARPCSAWSTQKSRPTPTRCPDRRCPATTTVTTAACSARSTSTPDQVAVAAAWSRSDRSRARPAAAAGRPLIGRPAGEGGDQVLACAARPAGARAAGAHLVARRRLCCHPRRRRLCCRRRPNRRGHRLSPHRLGPPRHHHYPDPPLSATVASW